MSPRPRRPIARHAPQRTPRAVGQLLSLVGIVMAVLLVSGGGVAAFVAADLARTAADNAVELEGQKELPPDIGAYDKGFDMLVIGLDECEPEYAEMFGKRCKGKDSEGKNNDVNLLIHVSNDPRRVTAISFPRDLMVDRPDCTDKDGQVRPGGYAKLNESYSAAGLSCVAKTVESITGQDIEFAASLTFGGVMEITDAVGGVEVCLASPMKDPHTGLNLSAGMHTVKGYWALQFLRTRHGLVGESDLSRIQNQQQYMTRLVNKLMSAETLGNVPLMLKLADTGLRRSETSTSLDPMRIVQIGLAIKEVPLSDIVFVQYPVFDDPSDSNRVIPDRASAKELWAAIEENRPLKVTHENSKNDGVVTETPAPGPTGAPTSTVAPSPGSTAVELPGNVKGNDANTKTCSNGKQSR